MTCVAERAQFSDLFRAQLGMRVLLSMGRAPLGGHVGRVVFVPARKEMRRVAAGWVVAAMTDEQRSIEGAVDLLKNHPMHVVVSHFPVAVGVEGPGPEPAGAEPSPHLGPRLVHPREQVTERAPSDASRCRTHTVLAARGAQRRAIAQVLVEKLPRREQAAFALRARLPKDYREHVGPPIRFVHVPGRVAATRGHSICSTTEAL